jgi:chemotaxis protein methyltransferase WspC
MIEQLLHQSLYRLSGLNLDWNTVARAIARRMKACGIGDEQVYMRRALDDGAEQRQLLELLVVPETWFFRDPEAFAAATAFAKELLERGRNPVRILSLPCSTGEEPYSIAMSLADAGIAAGDAYIEGIDISEHALHVAHEAVYGKNSFRTKDLGFRARYFNALKDEDRFVLHEAIRNRVRFSAGNVLAAEPPAGRWDIVFCRNLLIYFDEPTQREAIRRLSALLKDDGMLVAGYAEAPMLLREGFEPIPARRSFALRKLARQPAIRGPRPLANALPGPSAGFPPLAPTAQSSPRKPPAGMAAAASSAVAAIIPAHRSTAEKLAASPLASLDDARLHADQGRPDLARQQYEDIISRQPDASEAHFMLGLISLQQNDPRAAEACLRRAVYLDPNHYEALCHLALLAQARGDADGAASFRRRAARVYQRRARQGAGE